MANKPNQKPNNPCFSSGPCAKRPGWSLDVLKNFNPGRSHRSGQEKAKLNQVIELTKELLNIPAEFKVGILPASDTGAVETAMWSMLGKKPVDLFAWESFSKDWAIDAKEELKLQDLTIFEADYGVLPDLSQANSDHDIVFAYNGTTSGVRVPNLDWIKNDRTGITICDATSAVFAMEFDWKKLDVTTFSWQKIMGSEAAHGMIILSPKAVERLETYSPDRALPKIFRLTKKGKLIAGIFEGSTINTPSMLAVEDALDALNWIKEIGGEAQMIKRSKENLAVIQNWLENSSWVEFLAQDKNTISSTSICLKITDEAYQSLDSDSQNALLKEVFKLLEKEDVAYDIAAYRDAPSGIRIWGGGTVEAQDLKILTEWLNWAFNEVLAKYLQAA